eukprot:9476014-Pyramimonas_sp.AAC.2
MTANVETLRVQRDERYRTTAKQQANARTGAVLATHSTNSIDNCISWIGGGITAGETHQIVYNKKFMQLARSLENLPRSISDLRPPAENHQIDPLQGMNQYVELIMHVGFDGWTNNNTEVPMYPLPKDDPDEESVQRNAILHKVRADEGRWGVVWRVCSRHRWHNTALVVGARARPRGLVDLHPGHPTHCSHVRLCVFWRREPLRQQPWGRLPHTGAICSGVASHSVKNRVTFNLQVKTLSPVSDSLHHPLMSVSHVSQSCQSVTPLPHCPLNFPPQVSGGLSINELEEGIYKKLVEGNVQKDRERDEQCYRSTFTRQLRMLVSPNILPTMMPPGECSIADPIIMYHEPHVDHLLGLGNNKNDEEVLDGRLKRVAKFLRVEPSKPKAGKVRATPDLALANHLH